jgi:predicted RNase H-like nuclease (RuvC/YqgF family)
VAPFPGAETGTGGRIRDVQATGKGGLVVAGTAAYCVANLLIPDYDLPWEDKKSVYPSSLASPLAIEIRASDGASDYGNKFGEPVILGFTRSFDERLQNGDRWAWIKPIMFTGGIGQIDARHIEKGEAQKEVGAIHESPMPIKRKSLYKTKEERRKRAQEMDQFKKQLSNLEKRVQEVEKSLHEATQKLDHLNQRLSDPNLYSNQRETYETVQTHKQVQEQVRELTQLWEFLALELEEVKMTSLVATAED